MDSEALSPYTATGYLIARVLTGNGAIPLEGATVAISTSTPLTLPNGTDVRGGDTLMTLVSGTDGSTPRVALPTPPASTSLSPGSAVPFALYNISATLEGYEKQLFYAVPVFEGITSVQPVLLKPLPDNASEGNFSPYESRTFEGEAPEL